MVCFLKVTLGFIHSALQHTKPHHPKALRTLGSTGPEIPAHRFRCGHGVELEIVDVLSELARTLCLRTGLGLLGIQKRAIIIRLMGYCKRAKR